MPRLPACLLWLMTTVVSAADPALPPDEPAEGISRTLADWRAAQYSDLRHALRIEVSPGFDRLHGRMVMRWHATHRVDLILDWRPPAQPGGARLAGLQVNGVQVSGQVIRDHLVVPAAFLREGDNELALEFDSPIAPARTAVTRYVDREDGAVYLYSLFVPADASSVFPCIDQPDVKARFDLELVASKGNEVVANMPVVARDDVGDATRWRFAPSPPLSTYVFAFAVGPFAIFTDPLSGHRLFVRRSQEARARVHLGEVMRLDREGIRYFEDLFERAFPFPKHDLVLVPEFPYGGMEHAGATFLREDAVLFPSEPSAIDILRRAQLVFHEAAHQWFGDLVTMRWFDDLWLKEGFANLMAMRAAGALLPQVDARNAFRALKVSAYRTDVTAGTTPIWQPLPNLSAAKSAYGPIVYSKAPGVLHQLAHYVGEDAFVRGVRAFLAHHAFANARWEDLISELEQAGGIALRDWAHAWVTRAGLPRIDVASTPDGEGRIASLSLVQTPLPDVLHAAADTWPQRIEVLVSGETPHRFDVHMSDAHTLVPEAAGLPAPRFVFANAGDWGYGLFMLDAPSRDVLLAHIGEVDDAFLRALLWEALWEAVREGELAPAQWIDAVLRELPREHDDVTVAALLGNLQTALRQYLDADGRDARQVAVEAVLSRGMRGSGTVSLRIACFRAYVALAASASAREDLKTLLDGSAQVPGVVLRSIDRFRIVRTLLALADPDAQALLASLRGQHDSDDDRRHAYASEAARPDAATKLRYFRAFLDDAALPERWIEDALPGFNTPEQDALTLPLLDEALHALPRLKRERRIFFVNNWLGAFVGGQRSGEALRIVRRFLDENTLDADLRRKVLEVEDGLARTVAIRARLARAALMVQ